MLDRERQEITTQKNGTEEPLSQIGQIKRQVRFKAVLIGLEMARLTAAGDIEGAEVKLKEATLELERYKGVVEAASHFYQQLANLGVEIPADGVAQDTSFVQEVDPETGAVRITVLTVANSEGLSLQNGHSIGALPQPGPEPEAKVDGVIVDSEEDSMPDEVEFRDDSKSTSLSAEQQDNNGNTSAADTAVPKEKGPRIRFVHKGEPHGLIDFKKGRQTDVVLAMARANPERTDFLYPNSSVVAKTRLEEGGNLASEQVAVSKEIKDAATQLLRASDLPESNWPERIRTVRAEIERDLGVPLMLADIAVIIRRVWGKPSFAEIAEMFGIQPREVLQSGSNSLVTQEQSVGLEHSPKIPDEPVLVTQTGASTDSQPAQPVSSDKDSQVAYKPRPVIYIPASGERSIGRLELTPDEMQIAINMTRTNEERNNYLWRSFDAYSNETSGGAQARGYKGNKTRLSQERASGQGKLRSAYEMASKDYWPSSVRELVEIVSEDLGVDVSAEDVWRIAGRIDRYYLFRNLANDLRISSRSPYETVHLAGNIHLEESLVHTTNGQLDSENPTAGDPKSFIPTSGVSFLILSALRKFHPSQLEEMGLRQYTPEEKEQIEQMIRQLGKYGDIFKTFDDKELAKKDAEALLESIARDPIGVMQANRGNELAETMIAFLAQLKEGESSRFTTNPSY